MLFGFVHSFEALKDSIYFIYYSASIHPQQDLLVFFCVRAKTLLQV